MNSFIEVNRTALSGVLSLNVGTGNVVLSLDDVVAVNISSRIITTQNGTMVLAAGAVGLAACRSILAAIYRNTNYNTKDQFYTMASDGTLSFSQYAPIIAALV